jgi:hypothetical protein
MVQLFPVTHQQLLTSVSLQHLEGSEYKQPITLQWKITSKTLIKQNALGMSFTALLILLLIGNLARKVFPPPYYTLIHLLITSINQYDIVEWQVQLLKSRCLESIPSFTYPEQMLTLPVPFHMCKMEIMIALRVYSWKLGRLMYRIHRLVPSPW